MSVTYVSLENSSNQQFVACGRRCADEPPYDPDASGWKQRQVYVSRASVTHSHLESSTLVACWRVREEVREEVHDEERH